MEMELLNGFPPLVIDHNDVFGSWNAFIKQFELKLKLRVRLSGFKTVIGNDGHQVAAPVFDDEMKCLVLLEAIGIEGQKVIEAEGYDIVNNDLSYAQALGILNSHFCREDSVYVKTDNFVSVCQKADEDLRDYLMRVEYASRKLQCFKCEDVKVQKVLSVARENFTLAIAVNGLNDVDLRLKLMSKQDLSWKGFCDILKRRGAAIENCTKLKKPIVVEFKRFDEKHETVNGFDAKVESCNKQCTDGGSSEFHINNESYFGPSRFRDSNYINESQSVFKRSSQQSYGDGKNYQKLSNGVDGYDEMYFIDELSPRKYSYGISRYKAKPRVFKCYVCHSVGHISISGKCPNNLSGKSSDDGMWRSVNKETGSERTVYSKFLEVNLLK